MTAPILTATAPDPGDPGHLLSEEDWQLVVAGAVERLEQLANGQVSHGVAAVDRTITAVAHGGTMAGGPRLGVLHSAETPLAAGYAYSIAANWFGTSKAGTSATVMIDPAETIRLLPDNVVAYHVGPKGNGFTVGVEQAGYARLTRAEWLTVAGRQQMRRVAEYMVECLHRWGIPLRWATDAQVRAAAAGGAPQGWTLHDTIRRVLGGTTHSDPMPYYPTDELMALAISLANPNPTPTEDDMPQFQLIRNSDDGACVLAAPGGVWYGIPSPAYLTLLAARGLCQPVALNVPANEFGYFRDHVYANGAPPRAAARPTAAELPLSEEQVLAELERIGQPILTVEQITGAAPVLA